MLTMKAIVLFLLAAGAFPALQSTSVKGNGILKKENRKVGNFSKIQVGGAVEVDVKLGSSPSLKIEAESNLLPLYKTTIKGDTLVVHQEGSISSSKTVRLWITVPSLNGVKVSGASEMTIANLKASQFDAQISGASNLTANGTASSLILSASGASQLNFLKVSVKSAKVDASGASQINLNVANKISGGASGASEIAYRGRPTVSVSTSGASNVHGIR